MDNSEEDVTLLTIFVLDILTAVKDQINNTEFFEIYQEYDLSNPYEFLPITVYNNMCTWIEQNMEESYIIKIGNNIGESVYASLTENGIISETSTPSVIMDGLIVAASAMIDDPKDRGWETIDSSSTFILMKRTQTFNSKLQFGLLQGLIEKCPTVENVEVKYVKEVNNGYEFDEYLISWDNK